MLGGRIAALRRGAGLSQAELARQLKISPSAMGMYEQGRREPSLETLVDIADALGVSTDYLLTGKPCTRVEEKYAGQALLHALAEGEKGLKRRKNAPLSREELITLLAAVLADA